MEIIFSNPPNDEFISITVYELMWREYGNGDVKLISTPSAAELSVSLINRAICLNNLCNIIKIEKAFPAMELTRGAELIDES